LVLVVLVVQDQILEDKELLRRLFVLQMVVVVVQRSVV
jgi:hypothetical protein